MIGKTHLIAILLCTGSISVAWAGTESETSVEKPNGTWELIRKSQIKQQEFSAGENISVSELLDKYAENQDKLKSFICKWEISTELNALLTEPPYTALSGRSKKVRLTEFRCDGNRYSQRFYSWGNIRSVNDFIPKERAPYNSQLWDGKRFFNYVSLTNQPGELGVFGAVEDLPENMKPGQKYNLAGLNVILVRGFYAIDNERIDVALRKERNVSMRDKTEKLNGSDCYVIESECPSEKDTFWIDPRHGYSIAKAQARYKDRDLFISQENVCFRKIDDVWIVVEAVVKRIQKFRNGNFTDASRRDKLIEIKLNPDHERIGSFLPDDIVNGTTVLFRGNTWEKNYNHIRAATGHIKGSMRIGVKTYFNEQGQVVNYTWQDGRVVDANGQVITDFREKVSEGENNDAKH